ncbi:MAG: helix-turn-helix domain-containing protein [Bacteroidales bacterium]|nr:helix-turn-helix domain-containing protein [Bacteroidales bacterium]
MRKVDSIITAIAFCTLFQANTNPIYGQTNAESVDTEVTCMYESPLDGSMWMATSNDGLYRLGKNGSKLHFGAGNGKLSTNSIVYICFDPKGTLWIIGADGSITSYNAENGFKNISQMEDEIIRSIYLPKEDNILLASVTKYYYFNTRSASVESSSDLPFKPVTLTLSTDSTFVWIFGEKQVAKIGSGGNHVEWDGVGNVTDSVSLEFETYPEKKGFRGLIWLIAFVCLGAAVIVLLFIYFIGKRREKHEDPLYSPSRSVDVEVDEPALENWPEPTAHEEEIFEENSIESVTKSLEFTNLVTALIAEHYMEPDFDVDAIASLTGLSRIHVNRKLKAEGSPSPSVLIKERRMDIAKMLLIRNEMPMAQIASECGFRSASYFTTAFKDYTGLTPSEFVAQNRP